MPAAAFPDIRPFDAPDDGGMGVRAKENGGEKAEKADAAPASGTGQMARYSFWNTPATVASYNSPDHEFATSVTPFKHYVRTVPRSTPAYYFAQGILTEVAPTQLLPYAMLQQPHVLSQVAPAPVLANRELQQQVAVHPS